MKVLEEMLEAGFTRTEIIVNGYELYEHEKGKCVLYDPQKDYMMPFIEQEEYDAEG